MEVSPLNQLPEEVKRSAKPKGNYLKMKRIRIERESEEEKIEVSEDELPYIEGLDHKKRLESKLDPITIFHSFFTDEIIEMITTNTNKNMKNKTTKNHAKITCQEIRAFIYLHIYMSMYKYPQINLYWEDNILLSTKFSKIMSYSRFIIISQFFHISDYDEGNHKENRLLYFKCLLDKLNKIFLENRKYSKYLTIDESMASYQGIIYLKQYIKEKNRKWGIKFFALCESTTSYVYKLIPYTGKEFKYDKMRGIGPSVAGTLIEGVEKGTHITFDSFFSTMSFLQQLNKDEIYFTCTFLPTRKCYQQFFQKRMKENEMVISNIEGINFIVFNDKRTIYMASNKYRPAKINYTTQRHQLKNVPEMIYVYNKTKNGVDGLDQITSIYSTKRKTYKWWKAVFFYLLDVCIANSNVIFFSQKFTEEINVNSKMLYFRKLICDSFFSSYIVVEEITDLHFSIKLPKKKECRHCQSKRLKGQKHVSQTTYGCSGCSSIPLCLKCFTDYHLKLKEKK